MASMRLHNDPEAGLKLPKVGGDDHVHKRPSPLVPVQHLHAVHMLAEAPSFMPSHVTNIRLRSAKWLSSGVSACVCAWCRW